MAVAAFMTLPPGTTPPGPTVAPVSPPSWPHCGDGASPADPVGCRGRRVDPHRKCLAHLAPADRNAYLAGLAPGADVDHRGTTFDEPLLAVLLRAVRDPAAFCPRLGVAAFDGATFTGTAEFSRARFTGTAGFSGARFTGTSTDFRGAEFTGVAGFSGATFTGTAEFSRATFTSTAWFNGAGFTGDAGFSSATFTGDAGFSSTTFTNNPWFISARFTGTSTDFRGARFTGTSTDFRGARFTGVAAFDDATFNGTAGFNDATFTGDAGFSRARFTGDAWFNSARFTGTSTIFRGARFTGVAAFDDARFNGTAGFSDVTFTGASVLGPLACAGTLELSGARFEQPVAIEAAATEVVCRRTLWLQTATLRLRYAELDLTDAVVTQPLAVLAHPTPFSTHVSTGGTTAVSEAGLSGPATVRVASLRGVDAMHLVLTDTDLSGCRFTGAFHLDQVRLEGRVVFAAPPAGTRWENGLPWRWTRRWVLAEEHHWRALGQPPADPAAPTPAEWTPGTGHPDPETTPGPDDVAPVYRALRKAFEDAKNEPDAADFYYGECEMRRHDRERPHAEHFLLTAYWALSGYGLRASRALGWLLATMTATVLAMMMWGLPTSDPEPRTTGTQVAPGQRVDWVTKNPDPQLRGSYGSRFTAKRAEKAARVVVNSVVFRSSGQNLTTRGTYIEMASRFTEPVLLALAVLAVRGRVKR
jgi:uncharacterized protein YjbI with pentapeptide repeats